MKLFSEANTYFDQAYTYWKSEERPHLNETGEANLQRALKYSQTPEGRIAVSRRGRQLDLAIENFNTIRREVGFIGPHQKESAKLDKIILEKEEMLPTLLELPEGGDVIRSFLRGFSKLIHHGYYTFVDKAPLTTPTELNILITGLIVDGYGFAVRSKRTIEKRHGHPSSDLTIVNAICEMIPPGQMRREMYNSKWYQPTYGLDPTFCESIAEQYGA